MAGPVRHQGVPDGEAAAEGGPQPDKAHGKAKPRARARLRDKKQRPALSVRLNDRERAIIQKGADTSGMSMAGFLAHSALAAARDQSRTAATIADQRDVITELFAARRQLSYAGNNLNQVAKILNSGGELLHLDEAITDIRRAARTAQTAAEHVIRLTEGEAA
ncbi:plasmid mobilization relaxosome protein MobC [Streptomyces celluloflavus]|uniref:plasmid mobilization protein n=1 Tax=Streptomyces celluloflavus TaxID=58344 RepID=UPI0036DCD784